MEAGKACDAYGFAFGHSVQQADAEQAYIQSKLGVTPLHGFGLLLNAVPQPGKDTRTLSALLCWPSMATQIPEGIGKGIAMNTSQR